MPEVGRARVLSLDRSAERRLALGRILRPRALAILDNTVGHAFAATSFLGFGARGAKRYAAIGERAMPRYVEALEAGDAARIALLDEARDFVRELRAAGFNRFAMKPLVGLGFRLAQREVKAHAAAEGFDSKELEDELRLFQRAVEARIIYRR